MSRSWYHELKTYFFWRRAIAELLASSLYCFFATTMVFRLHLLSGGTQLQNQVFMTAFVLGFMAIALSHGFGITHNAYIFPAVTFGKCLLDKNSFLKALVYFIFQMAGGVIGASIDLAFNAERTYPKMIYPILKISPVKGCILEGILSFVFVLTVLSTYKEENGRRDQATPTLMFGFAVTGSFILGYDKTGAVLNSAIVFGINVIHNHWPDYVWVYWAGPLAGGISAGILYLFVLYPPKESDCETGKEESEPSYGLTLHEGQIRTANTRNTGLSYMIDSSYNTQQTYKNPAFDSADGSDDKK